MAIARRVECRCQSCKHEVLATQTACPECGHTDPGREIVGWVRDRGLRARWKATFIAMATLATTGGFLALTVWAVGVFASRVSSIAIVASAAVIAASAFALVALKGRDFLRRTLFRAPEWFVEWRLTDHRLTVGDSSLDLMNVRAVACDPPNRSGQCLILIASEVLRLDGTPLWRVWSGADEGRSRAIAKELLVRTARRREQRRLAPLDAVACEQISTALAAYKLPPDARQ